MNSANYDKVILKFWSNIINRGRVLVKQEWENGVTKYILSPPKEAETYESIREIIGE